MLRSGLSRPLLSTQYIPWRNSLKPIVALAALLLVSAPRLLSATTYYVDSRTGKDSNDGTSASHPWKTLDKVNSSRFEPGDRILFRAGSRWEGGLTFSSSGKAGSPIVVDRYGRGSLPRIDGDGKVENTLTLENVEQIEVRHLELTNHGAIPEERRGVLIAAVNFGTAHHIMVEDLYIHDVNGTNQRKETGGILFRTIGTTVKSRFDGLWIERNILWKVDRSAIVGESNEVQRSKWYPSLHVVISDNYAEDIGGDGIVPWATDGALVEGNIVLHCNQRAGSYNAGIWPWSADNTVLRLNEVAYTHTTRDGEGFDSDFNSRNTHFFYNYSHDNDGGFMLICTPGNRGRDNAGNTGTVIRYNISRNDHERIFNLSGADQTLVEHNAIYIGPKDDVQILLVSNWDGWSAGALFRDNIFDVAGTGRFGHEVSRDVKTGKYVIAPGWGGARDIRFEGNHYFGHNIDIPHDPEADIDSKYQKESIDWNEPVFDPASPDGFDKYLAAHRRWIIRLFTQQFHSAPQL